MRSKNRFPLFLAVMIFFGVVLLILRFFIMPEPSVAGLPLNIAGLALFCILLGAVFSLWRGLRLARKAARLANLQLEMQREEYKRLALSIDETVRARHDLRQHLIALQQLAEGRDDEGLRRYLQQCVGRAEAWQALALCNNPAVNAVIRHYFARAAAEGVEVSADIDLKGERWGISDTDLCAILGNCLENALEACRRMKTGDKYICVHMRELSSMLCVTIDNSFDGGITSEGKNGALLSRKRGGAGHGVGLASIREAVRRSGGTVKPEALGNEFRASVLLPLDGKK